MNKVPLNLTLAYNVIKIELKKRKNKPLRCGRDMKHTDTAWTNNEKFLKV